MNEHIEASIRNRIGFIVLDRPKALNFLSLEMIRSIMQSLLAWRDDPEVIAVTILSTSEKAFCAGGDIRFFHQRGSSTPQGGSYMLSRTPGMIGTYLGVTGETIGAADALYAGLADVFIPASQMPAVMAMLESTPASGIRNAMLAFAAPFREQADPAASMLAKHRSLIDRYFAADDVQSIIAGLAQEACPFSLKTVNLMQQRSPLMMSVALAQIRRGATMTLAECLRMERTMVRRCFEHGEVLEGVRAGDR